MRTDFLIVGGGAVGLTSAHALLQLGYRVTVLELGETGREASWAGGGILSPLCPWDYGEVVTRLALRGMDMFDEMAMLLQASTGIDPEYRRCGMLLLPPYREDEALAWCAAHRFPAYRVRLSDHLEGVRGSGLLLPDVAQVRNPRLLHALRQRVLLFGGNIVERCEVQGFDLLGDRVVGVRAACGAFTADAYIVAAGAWSRQLLGENAGEMLVRPVRGQMLLFKFASPPFGSILFLDGLYFIPRSDGHVLVGSTLEDVGFDRAVTTEAKHDMMGRVREVFPSWPEPVRQWSGFRPGSPGNIPTIGRHPYLVNLYANTGHFRYGVTMSLASAELLLNEIEGEEQPFEMSPYHWR